MNPSLRDADPRSHREQLLGRLVPSLHVTRGRAADGVRGLGAGAYTLIVGELRAQRLFQSDGARP